MSAFTVANGGIATSPEPRGTTFVTHNDALALVNYAHDAGTEQLRQVNSEIEFLAFRKSRVRRRAQRRALCKR
jgi:hypothetical protein